LATFSAPQNSITLILQYCKLTRTVDTCIDGWRRGSVVRTTDLINGIAYLFIGLWLGRRSLAGGLSLRCVRSMVDR